LKTHCGATKIHGELLKLGIAVAQSTVSIYMVPRSDRPLQTWQTFLSNHMEGNASLDLFVVPTIAFQRLLPFLVLGHESARVAVVCVTRNPMADWLARQITEAFPSAPKYLIRDNDKCSALCSKLMYERWGSGIDPRHSVPLGKTDMLNLDRLDPARVHKPFAGVS
jgi:hypothetical protein